MTDPLSYDSFYDPHLQTYFQNKNVRKHLRKVGLINRHDEIIPYKEYQTMINERSRQEHIKVLLANGIVQHVIELEKIRQANIRNQFESVAKKILVENIKESRHQYKQLRTTDFTSFNRPKTNITNNNHIHQQQIKIVNEYKESPSRLSSIRPSRSSSKQIRYKSPKIMKTNDNIKECCEMKMIYLGGQTNLDYKQSRFEIMIMQQHCGGQNIILFKNFLKINEKFTFQSHRHRKYPFALTLYVNGIIDCRISVCCEYKHKFGVRLGGKRGSFAILNVQGGQPCQTCRFNQYITNYPLFKQKLSDFNSIITDTSKSRTSDETNIHRLLRTPSPFDKYQNYTNISSQNG